MIDTGSLIIVHENGWACSKDIVIGMEFDIRPDKTASKTFVISITGLFDCVGVADGNVKGVIKFDSSGAKSGFEGVLYKKTRLEIKTELNDNYQTILKEVNKWQEYYKGN